MVRSAATGIPAPKIPPKKGPQPSKGFNKMPSAGKPPVPLDGINRPIASSGPPKPNPAAGPAPGPKPKKKPALKPSQSANPAQPKFY